MHPHKEAALPDYCVPRQSKYRRFYQVVYEMTAGRGQLWEITARKLGRYEFMSPFPNPDVAARLACPDAAAAGP